MTCRKVQICWGGCVVYSELEYIFHSCFSVSAATATTITATTTTTITISVVLQPPSFHDLNA